jgi:hypothetical protein
MEREEALNEIVHSLLEERELVDDPEWNTFAVLARIGPDVSEMSAFRYAGDERGKPTPLRKTRFDLFRRLRAATAAADGMTWQVCIIRIERDTRAVSVDFVYGEDADQWRMTPASSGRIAEALRPGSR